MAEHHDLLPGMLVRDCNEAEDRAQASTDLLTAQVHVQQECVKEPAGFTTQVLRSAACATSGNDTTFEPERSASPQSLWINGQQLDFWPTHWGITILQLRSFLTECQRSPQWSSENSLYDLVNNHLKPCTAGKGCGYALLVNSAMPLEVNIMVSHAWAENAERFVDTLERTVEENDAMFICAFALFQNEDGSGPSVAAQLGSDLMQNPFFQSLQHIHDSGSKSQCWRGYRYVRMLPVFCLTIGVIALAVPMIFRGCIPSLLSCYVLNDSRSQWVEENLESGYSLLILMSLIAFALAPVSWLCLRKVRTFNGRMVAVPNERCDIYQRLWCVYEIFVAGIMSVPVQLGNTLAHAGACSCREAECSSQEDTCLIQTEIEQKRHGYTAVDESIKKTMRNAWVPLLLTLVFQCWVFALMTFLWPVASQQVVEKGIKLHTGHVVGNILGTVVLYATLYYVAWKSTGLVSTFSMLQAPAVLTAVGITTFSLAYFGLHGHQCNWSNMGAWEVNITALLYNMGLFLSLFPTVAPTVLLCRHVLVRWGLVYWDIPLMLFTTAFWILLTASFTVVDVSQARNIYPSFVLICAAVITSCGPNLAIFFAKRWGVQWLPGPQVCREAALVVTGMCIAGMAALFGMIAVFERAMRCA